MTSLRKQIGIGIIGFGLGFGVNFGFPEPLTMVNPFIWVILLIIGILIYLKA